MSLPVEVIYPAETIRDRVQDLGGRLREDLGGKEPMLISLLGGSVMFVADLVRAIDDPVRYEFIQVQYTRREEGSEILEIQYPIPLDIRGQALLLVRDVTTSGVIETYLKQQLAQKGGREVQIATLVDMPNERKTNFAPDYTLFSLEERQILVGYGLKHEGRYGNLPYIGRLKEA